jgi:hypothetical protein
VTFNFPKTLMVLLLCLTFIGQAMASTIMSYQMMSMTGMHGQAQSQDMPMMSKTKHNMVSDPADNVATSTEDCCVKACDCFTGGCANLATLMQDVSNGLSLVLPSKILSFSHLALSQLAKSLYRPPIFS